MCVAALLAIPTPPPIHAWPATWSLLTADPARLMLQDIIAPLAPPAIMVSLLLRTAAVGEGIRSVRPALLAALPAPPTPPARHAQQD